MLFNAVIIQTLNLFYGPLRWLLTKAEKNGATKQLVVMGQSRRWQSWWLLRP